MGTLLSVVCPCYNEEPCIAGFVAAVEENLPEGQAYEIVFVDDGSVDGTLSRIRELAKADARIHYVSFSRNFGKEAALLAGLRKSVGDLVVTMDVDLQDPPSCLPEMLRALREEAYDSVATRRCTRKGEPPIRSWFARRFYALMRRLSDVELVDGARDFRMMRRSVVDAVLSLPERNRFTKGIYQWVGFRTKWISYENVERRAGETKWNFWKLVAYAIDGILAFTTVPLRLVASFGIVSCLVAFVSLFWIFTKALIWGNPVAGWPSLACIIIVLGGLQLFSVGILGEYLSKTYLETKKRPLYVIQDEG